MEFTKRHAFLIIFMIVFQAIAIGQSCKFKIMRGDDNLGYINASKKTIGTKVTYRVTSKASFRVVFKYVRETFMDIVFLNGVMESSVLKQTMNSELKDHRITKRNGMGYDCTKDSDDEFRINKLIRFCSSMLYFTEPKGQKYVFTESHQVMSPIKEIESGIYELSLPDGKINHYVYKSGVLDEVRAYRTVADLVFKRVY